MHGLMMNSPLTINSVMNYADKIFPDVEIVSVTTDNPRHKYTYKQAFARTLCSICSDSCWSKSILC